MEVMLRESVSHRNRVVNYVCILLIARRGERIGGAGQELERRHPHAAGFGRGDQAQVGAAHEHPRARLQRHYE